MYEVSTNRYLIQMFKNPWLTFNPEEGAAKFHLSDLAFVQAFNNGMQSSGIKGKENYILAEHLEPFPYLGDRFANVLLLLANPGKSEKEKKKTFNMDPEKVAQNRRNLRHEDIDSIKSRIHSPANPEFESVWLKPRVRELIEQTSIDRVTKGLFLVNFHAYHSKSWQPIPFTFPTQHYSFYLVQEAIKREALIIMSRNRLGWFTAVPELFEYRKETGNVVEFDSQRSVHMSKGNLSAKAFNKILERL